MNQAAAFHLAIPITNIAQAKDFYAVGLGCEVGRENKSAVIFNFYGNQLVGHLTKETLKPQRGIYPRHFGVNLPTHAAWQQICDRAQEHQLEFYGKPRLRFPKQPLEHHCFFLVDPFFNLLEFKHYIQPEVILGGTELKSIGDTGN
ncbi:MAG: VOC family protein [Cyanobacteria bacterium J06621_8]